MTSLETHVVLDKLNILIETSSNENVLEYIKRHDVTQDKYEQCIANDGMRNSPLAAAVLCGRVQLFKALLEIGFQPQTKCVYFLQHSGERISCDLLHLACRGGHLEMVKILVEDHRVNIDVEDDQRMSPLFHTFPSKYRQRYEIAKFLIKAEADVNFLRARDRRTPLHVASLSRDWVMVAFLLSHGADVNVKDKYGNTAIHSVVEKGDIRAARLLLDAGSDVSGHGADRMTPLHLAVENDEYEMVKFLCYRGAKTEAADKNGDTPVHYAVRSSFMRFKYDILYFLVVEVNVDLTKKNHFQETPFFIAFYRECIDTVNLLVQAGSDYSYEACVFYKVAASARPVWKEMVTRIQKQTSEPRNLQDMCCYCIRRSLGKKVRTTADLLPLPAKLKSIIKLEHIPANLESLESQ